MRVASLTDTDLQALRSAVQALEHPGLAARLTGMVGRPLDLLAQSLPASASRAISVATVEALKVALNGALLTMKGTPAKASRLLHKTMAVASGAFGGAFGLTTLPIELPVSTMIMLRSIADIARSEGESLHDPETALQCLQVFAMGGRTSDDDATESAYFVVRTVLAKTTAEAVHYIAGRSFIEEGAPLLVRFLSQVAARFGVVVTQKFAAQAVPVLGALGGAVVNYAFIDHFQDIARGHFTVRRLERKYGKDAIRVEYDRIRKETTTKSRSKSSAHSGVHD